MECIPSTAYSQEPGQRLFEDLVSTYLSLTEDGRSEMPGLSGVAARLEKEIDSLEIVPVRYDFNGQTHKQSLRDYLSRNRQKHEKSFSSRQGFRLLSSHLKKLRSREIGLHISKPMLLTPEFFGQTLDRHSRVIGHLDKTYSVHFDKTARYALTAADDCTIKVWDVNTGMIRHTFRGTEKTIYDISISHCNQLVVSCGAEKRVRVWSLKTGANLEVFNLHTSVVSGVQFLPYVHGTRRYFYSYGYDCNVIFYEYDVKTLYFEEPVVFNVRDAQGLRCLASTFSPSGRFVAIGDSQGTVRLFQFEGCEIFRDISFRAVPQQEKLDSLVWCHKGMAFVTASGRYMIGRIWRFNGGKWCYVEFQPPQASPDVMALYAQPKMRYYVSQVCWSLDDRYIVASGSDNKIRVYDAMTGAQKHCLEGHKREPYHLKTHPIHRNIVLSSAHDGLLLVWDIESGKLLRKFSNITSEHDAPASVLDLDISPDGTRIATVDDYGRLSIFGLGSNDSHAVPREQFLLNDYEPVDRDHTGFVLDSSTGIAPHLLPPPMLVNVVKEYHEDKWQRHVPGKEEDLTSTICPWLARSLIPKLPDSIYQAWAEEATATLAFEDEECYRCTNSRDERLALHRPASPDPRTLGPSLGEFGLVATAQVPPAARAAPRRRTILPTLEEAIAAQDARRAAVEVDGYRSEDDASYSGSATSEEEGGASGLDEEAENSDSDSDYEQRASRSNGRRDRETLTQHSTSATAEITTSSGRRVQKRVLDGEASETAPQPSTSRTRKRRTIVRGDDDDVGEHTDSPEANDELFSEEEPGPSSSNAQKAPATEKTKRPRPKKVVAENYLATFPDSMRTVSCRRFPYIAQLGDRIVYCKQGHLRYLDTVEQLNIYPVSPSMRPRADLDAEEFCLVEEVKYLREPYRLTSIRLAQLDRSDQKTGITFTVKLHDLDNCPDFLILRHHYDISLAYRLQEGDAMECILDGKWWSGTVTRRQAKDEEYTDSNWFCLMIRWDNGEDDMVSPWDCQPKSAGRKSETPATDAEEEKLGECPPEDDEWPGETSPARNKESCCSRMQSAIEALSVLPIVVPFATPVSLVDFPLYAQSVDYCIDLDTIIQRIRNRYYRRLRSLEQDIRFIAISAAQFNEPDSVIVHQSRVLVEALIRFARDPDLQVENISEFYDSMYDLPLEEITEYKRRQRPKKTIDPDVVRLALLSQQQQSSSSAANREAPWRAQTRSVLEAVLALPDAQHFASVRTMDETLRDNYDDPSTIRMLDSVLNGLSDAQSPMDVLEQVESVLEDVRDHIDDNRSRLHHCTTKVKDQLVCKMATIVDRFKSAMASFSSLSGGGGRETRGQNRPKERQPAYNTRSVDVVGGGSRRSSGIAPGFYRELANGSGSSSSRSRGRRMSPFGEQPAVARANGRSGTRREVASSDADDIADNDELDSPHNNVSDASSRENQTAARNRRSKKNQHSDSSDSEEEAAGSSAVEGKEEDDIGSPTYAATTTSTARRRATRRKIDSRENEARMELLDLENTDAGLESRESSSRCRRGRNGTDSYDSHEPSARSNGRYSTRGANNISKRRRVASSDEDDGSASTSSRSRLNKARPAANRSTSRRVNYAEEEDSDADDRRENSISQRGRLRTPRRPY